MSDLSAIEFTRWFLAIFFVAVAVFYTVRILLLSRRHRFSPVFTGAPGTSHFATHLVFRVFRALILVVCVARLIWPPLDQYLIPLDPLWTPATLLIGDALLLSGFSSALVVHFYMGADWRSGTRPQDQTSLITAGPFAVSRNPMMLCVITTQLGLFLALPTAFTLLCLVVGLWAVTVQVMVEERLLRQRFGPAYEAYSRRVPRWIFRS